MSQSCIQNSTNELAFPITVTDARDPQINGPRWLVKPKQSTTWDGDFSGETDPTKVFTSLPRIDSYRWLA